MTAIIERVEAWRRAQAADDEDDDNVALILFVARCRTKPDHVLVWWTNDEATQVASYLDGWGTPEATEAASALRRARDRRAAQ